MSRACEAARTGRGGVQQPRGSRQGERRAASRRGRRRPGVRRAAVTAGAARGRVTASDVAAGPVASHQAASGITAGPATSRRAACCGDGSVAASGMRRGGSAEAGPCGGATTVAAQQPMATAPPLPSQTATPPHRIEPEPPPCSSGVATRRAGAYEEEDHWCGRGTHGAGGAAQGWGTHVGPAGQAGRASRPISIGRPRAVEACGSAEITPVQGLPKCQTGAQGGPAKSGGDGLLPLADKGQAAGPSDAVGSGTLFPAQSRAQVSEPFAASVSQGQSSLLPSSTAPPTTTNAAPMGSAALVPSQSRSADVGGGGSGGAPATLGGLLDSLLSSGVAADGTPSTELGSTSSVAMLSVGESSPVMLRSSKRGAATADMDSMEKAMKRAAKKNLDFSGHFQGNILEQILGIEAQGDGPAIGEEGL